MADDRRWEWTSGDRDGHYWLWYANDQVAEVLWLQRGHHEHVAMARIEDSLNRPTKDCERSLRPTWACHFTDPTGDWTFTVTGNPHAAITVAFTVTPRNPAAIQQRILDALNIGRGLPAVTIAGAA